MDCTARLLRTIPIALMLMATTLRGAPQDPVPAVPGDPITTILDAFRTHNLVALDEGDHRNEQGHAFRLSLLRDARFAGTVNDIVVECGNALYQDLMDRFTRGEDVPRAALRQVWQNTTQPTTVWDVPIYEEFFRAVRDVNIGLPRERQIRVLLGDPPIDWNSIRIPEDEQKWAKWNGERDTHPADVIRREVLAKGRRALIVYGTGHLTRKDIRLNFTHSDWLLARLEADGTRAFAISTATSTDLQQLQPDIARWPTPTLAILRGTILGAADVTAYSPYRGPRFRVGPDGPDYSSRVPQAEYRALRMEDQFDALLYLGPPSSITLSPVSAELCSDSAYMAMRLSRLPWGPPTPPGAPSGVDRLKQYCATMAPK